MPKGGVNRNGVSQRIISTPRARNPVLVCGLPGSGYVGKLAADHLIDVFGAKRVAVFGSDSFPPQVNVKEDGTAEPLKAELFFAAAKKARDIFIFTADAQPMTSEGEYELSEAVLAFAKKCGVKSVYTLAAYITGAFSNSPKVYGAATSKRMLGKIAAKGVTLMKDGGISGMNGLMIGVAALRGMEGACLLGETSGYLVDAAASKSVLEALSKIMGVAVDTEKLKEKAEETKKVISQLQGMAEPSAESVQAPRKDARPGYIS